MSDPISLHNGGPDDGCPCAECEVARALVERSKGLWAVLHEGAAHSIPPCPETYDEALNHLRGMLARARETGEPTGTFGWALRRLCDGERVRRVGWNGKGMWLCAMPGVTIPAGMVNERTRKFIRQGIDLPCQPYIVMWTAAQEWQPGWLASQADMFAIDWETVE